MERDVEALIIMKDGHSDGWQTISRDSVPIFFQFLNEMRDKILSVQMKNWDWNPGAEKLRRFKDDRSKKGDGRGNPDSDRDH